MIRPIVDGDLDIDYWTPCYNAALHGLDHPGLNSGDVFLRDRSTHDSIVKGESIATRQRGKTQFDMAILSPATALTDKFPLALGLAAQGLFIGDLRARDISADVKLTCQTIH